MLAATGLLCAAGHGLVLASADSPKRILILYDEDKNEFPGLARIDHTLRDHFRSELGKGADVHSESLALSRFERPGYDSVLAEFFRAKYAQAPPDLVVAVMEPSLDFLLRHADTL